MTTQITSSQPTASITGSLVWVSDAPRNNTRAIAIRMDGETAKSTDGYDSPLRGITLAKSTSEAFDAAYGEDIFVGNKVTMTVRTENLESDLDAGKGLRGNQYFIGTGIELA